MFELENFNYLNCGVTPEHVQQVFGEIGEDISLEDAKVILDQLCFFTKLVVNQIIDKNYEDC